MRLLLARHGNTFEKGQTPFYVGARTDLPLTEEGRAQARALGAALAAAGVKPERVVCGPLRRTREHAELVCAALGLPAPRADARLTELDYGTWEGKTNAEVDALHGGPAARKAWDERRERPAGADFSPTEDVVRRRLALFEAELEASGAGLVLAVSSNGVLSSFLSLIEGAYEGAAAAGTLKTAPGRCGALRFEGPRREVLFWNAAPADLPAASLRA